MNINTTLIKGDFHTNFCEDFLFHDKLTDNIYLAAVMDGCSMGDDSHFASALFGKILKKIVKEITYLAFSGDAPPLEHWELKELGKQIIHQLAKDLRHIANTLFLEPIEILTTLNFALVNTAKNEAWLMVIGDGYFAAKGQIKEIDQDNRPDYLAYHLSEDFESWFSSHRYQFQFSDIRQLILATDGVGSFKKQDKRKASFGEPVENYLLLNQQFMDQPKPFDKKIAALKDQFGLIGADDIGIIQMTW